MTKKLTREQSKEILDAYVHEGKTASAALCRKYGVNINRGRSLASAKGIKPVWKTAPKIWIEKPPLPKIPLPSQKWLKEHFHYDPDTGIFTHIKRASGKVAGSLNHGYLRIWVSEPVRVQVAAHRLAWVYMTGSEPEYQIDHINLDRSDNRWENLREATQRQNSCNSDLRAHNKSGVKGVCWCGRRNKWRVTIKAIGKQVHLGYFENIEDGRQAYSAASKKYHGEYGRPL